MASPPNHDLDITISQDASNLVMTLAGSLDRQSARRLIDTARKALRKHRPNGLLIDASGIVAADSAGVSALVYLVETLPRTKIVALSRQVADMAQALPAPEPSEPPEQETFLVRVAESGQRFWNTGLSVLEFLGDVFAGALAGLISSRDRRRGSLAAALLELGADAIPVVMVIAALLGLILAFQAAYQLRSFGASIYVANLVALSAVRELSPLMVAVVVAGRSGSAIAAEIGTMKVGEELDALSVMGIQPVRFLVVPRILSITITQPFLTALGSVVSIAAGTLIAVGYLDLSLEPYLRQTLNALDTGDILHGLGKSILFGWIIVLIGAYNGLHIERSAEAVGKAATKTVVTIIFSLIATDGIITTINTLI